MSRIGRIAGETGKELKVLIQVDLAGESTKSGARAEEIPHILAAAESCPMVSVEGLMCLPPFFKEPTMIRPYFRKLRCLLSDLQSKGIVQESCKHLSMGMSNDFEVAVEEGATMIRIGTALFGARGD
jgi:pyridoxal phosphate enzyme (YggS family)